MYFCTLHRLKVAVATFKRKKEYIMDEITQLYLQWKAGNLPQTE